MFLCDMNEKQIGTADTARRKDMRTKLFLSHATPEDNKFASWLATKLELHGYDVWIDVKELDPANDFWNTIEATIRDEAVKFLFVATRTSILGNRDGVKKELAVADRVRKKELADFIVPLRLDDVSFDDFPVEILRQNAIDFYDDWATGLVKLLDYLEKQGISKADNATELMTQALDRWREVSASRFADVVSVNDYYYSNLFPVRLPDYLYAYNDVSIEPILANKHKPRRKLGTCVLTFVCPDCVRSYCGFDVANQALDLGTLLQGEVPIQVFDNEIRNPRSVCVNLINWAVSEMFYRKGMRLYRSTDKAERIKRYFFGRGARSKRHEKAKRPKALSGRYKEKYWHYAQSAYFTNFPFEGILFRAHLVFTDSNNDTLSDTQQVAARRSKGKRFFNNQWRDLLQAAIYSHSDGKRDIDIKLCCEESRMAIKSTPYVFFSSEGYKEPATDPLANAEGGFDDDDEESSVL